MLISTILMRGTFKRWPSIRVEPKDFDKGGKAFV